MRHYIALIHKEGDSDFGVSFPDFPGCVTAGSSLDEAMAMAAEALAGHIEVLAEDGEAILEPSSMEAIMSDPENRDGIAVLVRAPDHAGKVTRVNITLPENALAAIDRFAEKRGLSRSGLLLEGAKLLMEGDAAAASTKHGKKGWSSEHVGGPALAAADGKPRAKPRKRA
jgi:predicted RNase H-like HicB family nuclease